MPQVRAKRKVREAKEALYRTLVLEAAARVFAAKGYEDTKMEEIAQASGLSLGTLYSVFSGKAELFRNLHEAADQELLARVADAAGAAPADDPFQALLDGVRSYTLYFLDRPDLLRMHLREGLAWGTEDAGAGSPERTGAWRAGMEMVATGFQRCIDAGRVIPRDPRLMARMMIAMQQVELAHWLEAGERGGPGERIDPEEVVAEMQKQVARSFGRKPSH